jgi:hypothetical protein
VRRGWPPHSTFFVVGTSAGRPTLTTKLDTDDRILPAPFPAADVEVAGQDLLPDLGAEHYRVARMAGTARRR